MPVQKIYITTVYDYQKSRYETYFIYRWYDDDKAYLGDDNDGKVRILSVGLVKKF